MPESNERQFWISLPMQTGWEVRITALSVGIYRHGEYTASHDLTDHEVEVLSAILATNVRIEPTHPSRFFTSTDPERSPDVGSVVINLSKLSEQATIDNGYSREGFAPIPTEDGDEHGSRRLSESEG